MSLTIAFQRNDLASLTNDHYLTHDHRPSPTMTPLRSSSHRIQALSFAAVPSSHRLLCVSALASRRVISFFSFLAVCPDVLKSTVWRLDGDDWLSACLFLWQERQIIEWRLQSHWRGPIRSRWRDSILDNQRKQQCQTVGCGFQSFNNQLEETTFWSTEWTQNSWEKIPMQQSTDWSKLGMRGQWGDPIKCKDRHNLRMNLRRAHNNQPSEGTQSLMIALTFTRYSRVNLAMYEWTLW